MEQTETETSLIKQGIAPDTCVQTLIAAMPPSVNCVRLIRRHYPEYQHVLQADVPARRDASTSAVRGGLDAATPEKHTAPASGTRTQHTDQGSIVKSFEDPQAWLASLGEEVLQHQAEISSIRGVRGVLQQS